MSGPPPNATTERRHRCMSHLTTTSTGAKAKHPLLKLQHFNGSGSLETFLMKFQHMAAYLHWDDEDTFSHLCASLDGATGQVLWELSPHASTADLTHLLQTRFGTQLEAECFKAELRARRRAMGESLQTLYHNITRLVQLVCLNTDTTLAMHMGKETFITALNNANWQLEVMKREPATVEIALGHAIKLEAYEQSLAASTTQFQMILRQAPG